MLYALGSDLLASGHAIHTVLESSIATWARHRFPHTRDWNIESIEQDRTRSLDQVAEVWIAAARQCDAAIVIAPELEGTLLQIVRKMRSAGIHVRASDESFLSTATDKWRTSQCFHAAGVRHPQTWLLEDWLSLCDSSGALTVSTGPTTCSKGGWVVKRRWGAGSVDMRRFSEAQEIVRHAGAKKGAASPWVHPQHWIVQPWIEGQSASTAILAGNRLQSLGVMEQHFTDIESRQPVEDACCSAFAYAGGCGPLQGISNPRLTSWVQRVLSAFPGEPKGWIGVDMILEAGGAWAAIEINPRLTSSYLGYRQLYGPRLSDGLVQDEFSVPTLPIAASCCFSVDDFHG